MDLTHPTCCLDDTFVDKCVRFTIQVSSLSHIITYRVSHFHSTLFSDGLLNTLADINVTKSNGIAMDDDHEKASAGHFNWETIRSICYCRWLRFDFSFIFSWPDIFRSRECDANSAQIIRLKIYGTHISVWDGDKIRCSQSIFLLQHGIHSEECEIDTMAFSPL